MRVRFKWERPEPRSDLLRLFGAAQGPQRSRLLPMLWSTAAHGAIVLLLPLLANVHWAFSRETPLLSQNRVEWMRLRVPETIFYAPPLKPQHPQPRPRAARSDPQPGPDRAQAAPRPVRPFDAPKLELPASPKPALMAPPILQPAYRKNKVDLAKSLPALAYWAPREPEAPKPVRKAFVAPGKTEPVKEPPVMAAAPALAIPNREAALREINIASAIPSASPALPIPPSATAPIRDKPAEPKAGALNSAEGEAANVIVLSEKRAQTDQDVSVPKGLQNIPKSGSAGDSESNAGAGAQNAARRNEGNSGGPSSASAAVKHSADETRATSAPAPSAPQKVGVSRITHPPNGAFDVVVMQVQAVDDLPVSKARLSGSPIYTVYLEVGDKKRWLLEFCTPRDARASNSFDIYIESGAADEGLTPPYPVSTAVPDALFRRRPKPAVFHGYLTVSGRFRNLEAREASATLVAELKPLLDEWRLRPATRTKVPVEVEVLLVIPAVSE